MTTKTCIKCGVERPIDQFYKHPAAKDGFGGRCKPCIREADRLRNTKSGRSRPTKPQAPKAAPPPPPAPVAQLAVVMAPGLGFEAEIDSDDGVLRVRQSSSDGGVDELVLSRTEAKVLFAQFHDWVHG